VQGSILTTDGEAARNGRRRYVYNQATCICSARVKSWEIANRTAYACLVCQPKVGASSPCAARNAKLFSSKCAPDTSEARLASPTKMNVAELRAELASRLMKTTGTKDSLIARLSAALKTNSSMPTPVPSRIDCADEKIPRSVAAGTSHLENPVCAETAAAEKAAAGESRAVEHVAEVSNLTDAATAVGKMKLVDIRAALRERSLSVVGTKSVLVERLIISIDMGSTINTTRSIGLQKSTASTALAANAKVNTFAPSVDTRRLRSRRN
jgi:SAP domain